MALVYECVVDIREMILPDWCTLLVFLAGILVAQFDPIRVNWTEAMLGLLSGAGGSWLVREIMFWIMGEESMGLGDVKLLGAAGTWVGASGIISVVFYGAVLTLLVIFIKTLIRRGWNWKQVFPFGPGLALGLLLTLGVGEIEDLMGML